MSNEQERPAGQSTPAEEKNNPYAAPRSAESDTAAPSDDAGTGKWILITFCGIWVAWMGFRVFNQRDGAMLAFVGVMLVIGGLTYRGSTWGRRLAQGYAVLMLFALVYMMVSDVLVANPAVTTGVFVYHAALFFFLTWSRHVRAFLQSQAQKRHRHLHPDRVADD